jgi:hypothetical protein
MHSALQVLEMEMRWFYAQDRRRKVWVPEKESLVALAEDGSKHIVIQGL